MEIISEPLKRVVRVVKRKIVMNTTRMEESPSVYHNSSPSAINSLGAEECALFALNFLLFLAIVLGNSLTVAAILKTPELRTQPNVYVLNLAVADCIVGVSVGITALMHTDTVGRAFNRSLYLCLSVYVLTYFSSSQSLLLLSAIAVDRLMYVVYPYLYVRFFTERNTRVITAIVWLLSVLMATLPLYFNVFTPKTGCDFHLVMDRVIDRFVIPLQILVIVVITVACYAKIASVSWKQRKAISAQWHLTEPVQGPGQNAEDAERPPQLQQPAENTSQAEAGLPRPASSGGGRSIGLYVTVNCLFAVCWLPYIIENLLPAQLQASNSSRNFIFFLAMSNSAMNTLILACVDKQFARAYRRILEQIQGCTNTSTD